MISADSRWTACQGYSAILRLGHRLICLVPVPYLAIVLTHLSYHIRVHGYVIKAVKNTVFQENEIQQRFNAHVFT